MGILALPRFHIGDSMSFPASKEAEKHGGNEVWSGAEHRDILSSSKHEKILSLPILIGKKKKKKKAIMNL